VAADLLESAGMTASDMEEMYRLLAIAKYDERYVVPAAHREDAAALSAQADGCSLDGDGGPGMSEFHPTGVTGRRGDGRLGLKLFVGKGAAS
ncbi:nitrate reductase subunit beta, partial [Nonomuraea basaltis]